MERESCSQIFGWSRIHASAATPRCGQGGSIRSDPAPGFRSTIQGECHGPRAHSLADRDSVAGDPGPLLPRLSQLTVHPLHARVAAQTPSTSRPCDSPGNDVGYAAFSGTGIAALACLCGAAPPAHSKVVQPDGADLRGLATRGAPRAPEHFRASSVVVSGDAAQALARLGCSGRPRMSKNRA